MTDSNTMNESKRAVVRTAFLLKFIPRTLRHWLNDEVGFTVLPLIVLALVLRATAADFDRLRHAPEWSFAAIVLFGSSIRKVVELYGWEQVLPRRLRLLPRLLLIPMILSTTTFALAVSGKNGGVQNGDFVADCQLFLFSCAVLTSFIIEFVGQAIYVERRFLPEWITKYRYFRYLDKSLDRAIKELRYCAFAISRKRSLQLYTDGAAAATASYDEGRQLEVVNSIEVLERTIAELRAEIESKFDYGTTGESSPMTRGTDGS